MIESRRDVEVCRPSLLRGLGALTRRELKKWLKDPLMLAMFILQPLIWMSLLGKSMNIGGLFSPGNIRLPREMQIPGAAVIHPQGLPSVVIDGEVLSKIFAGLGEKIMEEAFGVTDYFSFMSMGMISMITVMTTMFSGLTIVWDRRLGFLEKVMSTPVPRAAIILSKILNSAFRAIFQATVILALAYVLGLRLSSHFTLLNLLGIYAAIILLCLGFSSIFLAFSIRSTRMERPMQFVNLVTMPLIFASNIFFPARLMPDWLQVVVNLNPITYFTDAIRQLTVMPLDTDRLVLDFTYLAVFAAIFTAVGVVLSWRYLTQ